MLTKTCNSVKSGYIKNVDYDQGQPVSHPILQAEINEFKAFFAFSLTFNKVGQGQGQLVGRV